MTANNEEWGDLEDFRQTRTRMTGPIITISENRIITLSVGFLRNAKEQLSGNTHTILSYSRARNAIVFRFVPDENLPGAIKISIRDITTNSSSGNLAAKSFFAFYSIDVDKYTGRYTAKLENIPGREPSWVLYLNEAWPQKEEIALSKANIFQNPALEKV